jgi:hypothetical protein
MTAVCPAPTVAIDHDVHRSNQQTAAAEEAAMKLSLTIGEARGLVMYLALWAIVFPIQTAVVFSANGDGSDVLNWVFNELILCFCIGLNRLGSVLGERKRARSGLAEAA